MDPQHITVDIFTNVPIACSLVYPYEKESGRKITGATDSDISAVEFSYAIVQKNSHNLDTILNNGHHRGSLTMVQKY